MTKYVVVMEDVEVRSVDLNESEIPEAIESGFVSAVLKIVDGEIRYAVVDWDEYTVKEWKLPEQERYE